MSNFNNLNITIQIIFLHFLDTPFLVSSAQHLHKMFPHLSSKIVLNYIKRQKKNIRQKT